MLFNDITNNSDKEEQLSILEGRIDLLESLLLQESEQTTTQLKKVAQRASYEYIDLTLVTKPSGVSFTYDGTKFKNSLADGDTLVEFRVIIDSPTKTILNENKISLSSIILTKDLLRSQIEVRVKIKSKDGLYRYSALETIDLTKTVDMGVKRVSLIPNITSINAPMNLEDAYAELKSEIEDIKNSIK